MTSLNPSKHRFAPIPIETTFQSNRKGSQPGRPHPELTPEPSPRSSSPPTPEPRQRRRFKPQLIETSRRTRRVGDPGPATKPTDKTDITPYTNHIYVAKSKPRRKVGEALDDEAIPYVPPTRRESEDEGVKEYLLEIAAKEAARQMEEAALAAFPNSRAREGGVAHFYFRDNSESDNSAENTLQDEEDGIQSRTRRKSSNLGLNWWHRHMQNHAEQLAYERGDDDMALDMVEDTIMRTDSDLDKMDLPVPPDPLWTTTNRIAPDDRRASMVQIQNLRDSLTPLARPEVGFEAGSRFQLGDTPYGQPFPDQRDISFKPSLHPADRGPDVGFRRPFAALGLKPEDPKLHFIRQAASPPMLGKDIKFRRCPSPKQTKLETDHPFANHDTHKEHNRDVTGQGGLWRGYCCRSESNSECVVPAELHSANMLVTPYPPGSPRDSGGYQSRSLSDEPDSMFSSSNSSDNLNLSPDRAEYRFRNGHTKGLHMLHGLDNRLRREKADAERDEKIASEFDDEFITQVYNYLSLGYPAMARSFDEELSKISRVTVEDLCRDDEKQMAKGHMLEMDLNDTLENGRCPRWKALKTYITEWARQHPDLDNLDSLAWGVRERRGSWAI